MTLLILISILALEHTGMSASARPCAAKCCAVKAYLDAAAAAALAAATAGLRLALGAGWLSSASA